MDVEKDNAGTTNETIKIRNIPEDMGHVKMNLMQQSDGDVILTLSDGETTLSAEYCTLSGGGRNPIIAKKLRELIKELVQLCPQYPFLIDSRNIPEIKHDDPYEIYKQIKG